MFFDEKFRFYAQTGGGPMCAAGWLHKVRKVLEILHSFDNREEFEETVKYTNLSEILANFEMDVIIYVDQNLLELFLFFIKNGWS